jgi:hypothetical protein
VQRPLNLAPRGLRLGLLESEIGGRQRIAAQASVEPRDAIELRLRRLNGSAVSAPSALNIRAPCQAPRRAPVSHHHRRIEPPGASRTGRKLFWQTFGGGDVTA